MVDISLAEEVATKLIKLLNSRHMGYGVLRNFLYVGKTKPALVACEEALKDNEEDRKILETIRLSLKDELGVDSE